MVSATVVRSQLNRLLFGTAILAVTSRTLVKDLTENAIWGQLYTNSDVALSLAVQSKLLPMLVAFAQAHCKQIPESFTTTLNAIRILNTELLKFS